MLLLTWFSSHQALTGIPLSTSALARSRHISTDSSTFKATSLDPTTGREIVSYLGAGLNALVFYQTPLVALRARVLQAAGREGLAAGGQAPGRRRPARARRGLSRD